MVKILIATLLVVACAGCAGASGGSSSAGSSGITMYGVIDQGISVRK
jgi:hypothetical protein